MIVEVLGVHRSIKSTKQGQEWKMRDGKQAESGISKGKERQGDGGTQRRCPPPSAPYHERCQQ